MVGCLSVSAERGLSSAVGTLSPYCKPIGQDLAAAVAKSTAVGPVALPGSLPSTNEDTNLYRIQEFPGEYLVLCGERGAGGPTATFGNSNAAAPGG